MKKILSFAITVMLFTAMTTQYSLEGAWKLTVDETYTEISQESEVIFNFHKDIEEGKIVNRVTVYGCAAIIFKYTLADSDISFTYERTLPTKRECLKNENGEIRRRIQKVYYTITVANNLVFLSPSGSSILKMKKVKTESKEASLAGVWNIIEAQEEAIDVIAKVNSTSLQFCAGNGQLSYQVSTKNDVRFVIENTKNCSENQLFTALFKSRYYRSKGSSIVFYDSEYNIESQWVFMAEHPENESITFKIQSVQAKSNSTLEGNMSSQEVNKSLSSNDRIPVDDKSREKKDIEGKKIEGQQEEKNQIVEEKPEKNLSEETTAEEKQTEEKQTQEKQTEEKIVEEKPVQPQPAEEKNIEQKNIEQKQVEDKLVEQKDGEQKPPVEQKKEEQPRDEKESDAEKSVEQKPGEKNKDEEFLAQEQPEQKNVNEKSVAESSELLKPAIQYLNPISVEQISTKWYSHKEGDSSKTIVFTSSRVMIYGSCGVYLTTFTLGEIDGEKLFLTNISTKNTFPKCKVAEEKIAEAVTNTSYLKVKKVSEEIHELELYSSKDLLLVALKNAPSNNE